MKELTRHQCLAIAGGDPGGVLGGSGNSGGGPGMGSGGSGDAALMALASMGVGVAGGPMVAMTVGLPMETQLGDFDKALIGAAGGSAAGFVGAVGAWALEGATVGVVLGPAGVAVGVASAVAAGVVGYGVMRLLQYANDDEAYAGHVRHALR
jgi:hypothetical protein